MIISIARLKKDRVYKILLSDIKNFIINLSPAKKCQ